MQYNVLKQERPGDPFNGHEPVMLRRDRSVHIRVGTVKGQHALRLEVTTGNDGDTGDRIDWCHACFILE